MNRTNHAGPMCEPKKRLRRPRFFGACWMRSTVNTASAATHSRAKRSSKNPNQAKLPTIGIWKSGLTNPMKASTIVNNRTMKPQNTRKCAAPGTVQRRSLRWKATSATSARTAEPGSTRRSASSGWNVLPTR
jgi:hypothetical protein